MSWRNIGEVVEGGRDNSVSFEPISKVGSTSSVNKEGSQWLEQELMDCLISPETTPQAATVVCKWRGPHAVVKIA